VLLPSSHFDKYTDAWLVLLPDADRVFAQNPFPPDQIPEAFVGWSSGREKNFFARPAVPNK
jgi:hypothetical protein